MSPAAVTENEGECKASEPVQYPLCTEHLCLGGRGGGKEPLGAWREGCEPLVLVVPGYYYVTAVRKVTALRPRAGLGMQMRVRFERFWGMSGFLVRDQSASGGL